MQCLAFGRPSSLNMECSTTRFPTYHKMGDEYGCVSSLSATSSPLVLTCFIVHQWMHTFTRTIFPHVLEVALGNSIDYDIICKLADRIKRLEIPPILDLRFSRPKDASSELLFQRCVVQDVTAVSMSFSFLPPYSRTNATMIATLKINTGWFAEVLSKTPNDIDSSHYRASVINVHKSSLELIEVLEVCANDDFEMLSRWGIFWSNAFNAAVRPIL
jgi:hypothetical protein